MGDGKRVVVIGAGMAGVAAAWHLHKNGYEVQLVESLKKAGGRIDTAIAEGEHVEQGMQFYYSAYTETNKLLEELDLKKLAHPVHIKGQMIRGGKKAPFNKKMPWLSLLSAGENLKLWGLIARQGLNMLALNVFDYEADEKLDSIDVGKYFGGSKAILDLVARPMTSSYGFVEPEGHSMAMVLRIMKLGASAKTFVLPGGNDSLARSIAERVNMVWGRAQKVVFQKGRPSGVVVEQGKKKKTLKADHVICATPAPETARLIAGHKEVAQQIKQVEFADIVLTHLYLDRPLYDNGVFYIFSRDDGYSASFAIDCVGKCRPAFTTENSILQLHFTSPLATMLLKRKEKEIIQMAIDDIKAFYPDIEKWIIKTSVKKRSPAIPNFKVGAFRTIREAEQAVTSVPGLYIAGDYLKSPLAEGAVRSGLKAAQLVMNSED